MADAAVSFAIENVGNFLIQKGKFLSGVRDEVEEMQIELEWMQCFLKDAERRKGESHRVRNWVTEIRKATYDVEDVVERFVLKSALRNRKGVMNRIKKYAFFINHIVELHQVGSRIEDIKSKLSKLRTRMKIYGIKELSVGGEEAAATGGRRKRQDYAHVDDPNVVGLDGKINELVERLIDAKEASSVVHLYGMGGLGKTTTAKKVYSDSRIRAHFQGFAWVYISQQCNHRQVWESILTQLTVTDNKEDPKSLSDADLTSKLCHIQKERKCLLVIDDIWSSQDWDSLSAAFPYADEDGKSKILLTSRKQSVASHGVYRTSLDSLDHDNSLELLKNTILYLGGPNHPVRENLSMEKSAGEMVKQCAGLPLAVVVLGGILASKHGLAEWERVGDNIKLVLKRGEQKGTCGVLESSYMDLPFSLKSCFLYFSQYAEDEEIKVTELIQRWIGEGFVPSSMDDGDETMENVAEGYLNELVNRCVVQVGRRGHTGRVKTCRMHDLMLDLCISKAKEEGFAHTVNLGVENEGTVLERVITRRLCISFIENECKIGGSMLSSFEEIFPQLRSTLFREVYPGLDHDQEKAAMVIIKKLKLVRVLELPKFYSYSSRMNRREHIGNEHIGNLMHLRLLKLPDAYSKLPTSIGKLRCLQTLKLENCSGDLKIPDSIWGMEQLRHLYLPYRGGGVCESSNQRVSGLRNLQTLVNFPPKKFDLQQNLVKFTSVRKLVIRYIWEEDTISRSQEIVFNRLRSLSFWTSNPKYVDFEDIARSCPRLYRLAIFGRIRFPETTTCTSILPSNLTKLVLRLSYIDERHMGTLAKLQSLKVLFLEYYAFMGKEMVFHRNDFPQLHHLKLHALAELEAWSVHEGALPSLLCLEIAYCNKLKSVADGSQFLKQLKELKVEIMPYSFQTRLEQDWDRVSHDVPSISFSMMFPDHRLEEFEELDKQARTAIFRQGPDAPPQNGRPKWTSYFASKMSIPFIS